MARYARGDAARLALDGDVACLKLDGDAACLKLDAARLALDGGSAGAVLDARGVYRPLDTVDRVRAPIRVDEVEKRRVGSSDFDRCRCMPRLARGVGCGCLRR